MAQKTAGATKPRSHAEGAVEDTLFVVVSAAAGVTVTPILRRASVGVGRAPDCDVVIDDDSVSRRHATLVASDDAVEVLDESMNGTFVLGQRLARGERARVAIGTPISIGTTTAYVLRARPPALTAAPTADSTRVVHDPAMQRIYALVDVFAPSPLSVLILGETGVGKEVFADAIHTRSPRAGRPLVKLNCAALPESIVEAELFGYEKGAFTGATQAKPGLFEAADGGTAMLDEIAELPLATQAKLLRVLETGEVRRLGSVTTTTVDVRVVSATNRDLRTLAADGRFRADLFYRIDGVSVVIPPLRERIADIAPLAQMFIERVARKMGRAAPALAPAAIEALERHAWPGNVRELRNVVERAVVLCNGAPTIVPAQLAVEAADAPMPLRDTLDRVERERIVRALDEAAGNQTRAAKLLGISRHALLDRLERYQIKRPRRRR
jgi:transcriptional regulator with PAS, ATPase and Fis domain